MSPSTVHVVKTVRCRFVCLYTMMAYGRLHVRIAALFYNLSTMWRSVFQIHFPATSIVYREFKLALCKPQYSSDFK